MKKAFILLAAVILCGVANAQYYYYTNAAPWDGNKAYSINVGTDFSITPRNFGELTTDLVSTPGLAASFRYEGDKNISEKLSWGYQVELSYLSQNFSYNKTQTEYPTSSSTQAVDVTEYATLKWWDGQLDLRLSFSYWLNDNIELQAAAGIFYGVVYGVSGETYKEITATHTEIPGTRDTVNVPANIFSFDMGVSTLLQCKYFFNENFFVSLSARDNIGLNFFGDDFEGTGLSSKGGQRGVIMAGVGYKFIK